MSSLLWHLFLTVILLALDAVTATVYSGHRAKLLQAAERHGGVPEQQATAVERSTTLDTKRDSQADEVREAIRHLWQGYRAKAWGADEIRPISGMPKGRWGDVGMAIIDMMDTLWLAGMHKEFSEGEQWVAGLKLDGPSHGHRTSFFEMTIRGLGGLLSSYALSGHHLLLEKARELGDHLIPAFPEQSAEYVQDTYSQPAAYQVRSWLDSFKEIFFPEPQSKIEPIGHHSWPAAYIDVRNPIDMVASPSWLGKVVLADAGSNIIEFSYLSEATGDPRYKAAADNNEARLLQLADDAKQHLLPQFLEPRSLRSATPQVTVGAFGDSYFEYLLKSYLQSGQTERKLLQEWKAAMQEMQQRLLHYSEEGFAYLSVGGSNTMDHLSCFMGGLLALGAHLVPKEDAEDWWLPLGIEITRTCYELYHRSPSGLAPDTVEFDETITPLDRGYRLRPETLESLFYLYRVTGNETYRQWSWEIFEAINKHTRTSWGFASVRDASKVPVVLEDSEETFMGAETLKYALLIHLPEEVLPLDHFIMNTEAHPLPVIKLLGNGPFSSYPLS